MNEEIQDYDMSVESAFYQMQDSLEGRLKIIKLSLIGAREEPTSEDADTIYKSLLNDVNLCFDYLDGAEDQFAYLARTARDNNLDTRAFKG